MIIKFYLDNSDICIKKLWIKDSYFSKDFLEMEQPNAPITLVDSVHAEALRAKEKAFDYLFKGMIIETTDESKLPRLFWKTIDIYHEAMRENRYFRNVFLTIMED